MIVPNNRKITRKLATTELFHEFLGPILRFSGLKITPEGYLESFNNMRYKNIDKKDFIVITNNEQFEHYKRNADFVVPFRPYSNRNHMYILMKFLQNAIFQLDTVFDEYMQVYGSYLDPETLSKQAEECIKLSIYPKDPNGCKMLKWWIIQDMNGQKLDKLLGEMYYPGWIDTTHAILVSMFTILDFYNNGETVVTKITDVALLKRLAELLDKSEKEFSKFKENFNQAIKEEKFLNANTAPVNPNDSYFNFD